MNNLLGTISRGLTIQNLFCNTTKVRNMSLEENKGKYKRVTGARRPPRTNQGPWGHGQYYGKGRNRHKRYSRFFRLTSGKGSVPFWKRIPLLPPELLIKPPLYRNIDFVQIMMLVRRGYLDPSKVITMYDLLRCSQYMTLLDGVRLEAAGAEFLDCPLHIELTEASEAAIAAVEKVGGTFKSVYVEKELMRIWERTLDLTNRDYYGKFNYETMLPEDLTHSRWQSSDTLRKAFHCATPVSIPPSKLLEKFVNDDNRGFLSQTVLARYDEFK